LDARNETTYFELPCRTILNRCAQPRMPFDFTINPYRGCEFGCTYCYARYTHEFLELPAEQAFERQIYVKKDAAQALARELATRRRPLGPIAIGTATDPYQPAERRLGITRSILEVLARHPGLEVSITTKSDLVVRDLDLLQEIAKTSSIHVNVTVTTLDGALARSLEPRAPVPEQRLQAVARLSQARIRAGVFCMPILPFVTDDPAALRRLLFAAAEARAHFFTAQVLFLKSCSRPTFFRWLEAERPRLVPVYRSIYGRTTYAPAALAQKIKHLVDVLRVPYGLPAHVPRAVSPCPGFPPMPTDPDPASGSLEPAVADRQLGLFGRRGLNRTG
jgi:DNA repair photolyase